VVGANWGLFSADREPVFPLTGPVSENSDWLIRFIEATTLWLLIVAVYFKKLQAVSLMRALFFLIFAQVLCAYLLMLWDFLWYTSYSPWQRGYAVFMVVANALLGGLLVQRGHEILAGSPGERRLANRLRSAYLLFIALALYKTYGLAVNGRYLSFPVEQFAIPVIGLCGLMVSLCLTQRRLNGRNLALDQLTGWNLHTHRDRIVAYFLSLGIVAMVLGETKAFMDGRDFIQAHPGFSEGLPFALGYTLHNWQLLAWLACLFILSIPFWNNVDHKTQV